MSYLCSRYTPYMPERAVKVEAILVVSVLQRFVSGFIVQVLKDLRIGRAE